MLDAAILRMAVGRKLARALPDALVAEVRSRVGAAWQAAAAVLCVGLLLWAAGLGIGMIVNPSFVTNCPWPVKFGPLLWMVSWAIVAKQLRSPTSAALSRILERCSYLVCPA